VSPVKQQRATYQDVIDAPEHTLAEIIGGELRLSLRPAAPPPPWRRRSRPPGQVSVDK